MAVFRDIAIKTLIVSLCVCVTVFAPFEILFYFVTAQMSF